ncbi:hypothetical protein CEXT_306341 [Caerostris extrusa]|uniref:Uncharacterized protein n=1 Tax=Caerostris extrusa TaxID=172846 RepID=A0AAV4NHM5_CAEEX|nr:hypothetical protein CEXT_306341 [Caerostris extrusa]
MLCMETDDIEGTDLFRSTPKYPRSLLRLLLQRCFQILMKNDVLGISPHSYEERHCSKSAGYFNATTFGHALDEDDHVKLKTLEQDLINALRER